jgi:hypothetical protein
MNSHLSAICLVLAVPALSPADWIPSGSLTQAREGHTAVLLADGRLLVIGGTAAVTTDYSFGYDHRPKSGAEVYDPVTGAWTATGSLRMGRHGFTATLLRNGTVLVAGGNTSGYFTPPELYDPTAGTWRPTPPMIRQREFHTATLLPNGKVLVIGGFERGGFPGSTSPPCSPMARCWPLEIAIARRKRKSTIR